MIEIGHDATDVLLTQYESAIPGKSSQYILLCDLRCYYAWFTDDYISAIRWGEEGEYLKNSTLVDTVFSTKQHLALALRDERRINEAINIFLEGETFDSVTKKGHRIEDKYAPFYGNIGRCLYFDNDLERALACYVKSAQLLEEGRSLKDRLNKGYIRLWIAELLELQGKLKLAAVFLRAAICMWEVSSPPRAVAAEERLRNLASSHSNLDAYLTAAQLSVEDVYKRWLYRQ